MKTHKNRKEFGVAVKALIKRNDKFLILHKSSEEDINPNSYDIPGGRISFGETLKEALEREILEETGLDVTVGRILEAWTFTKNNSFQLTGINYLCSYSSGKVRLSAEHDSYKWVCVKDILTSGNYPEFLVGAVKLTTE
ncbi:NUDIX domain-containing protein [Candidatus Parcubacteria bacterium]|nr:NUDIX domain-containing protein [Patescibacteria group bacterium]MCG2688889.1 NUDIX domain-containing protein [Candidatus Parcubacteria bacterium]